MIELLIPGEPKSKGRPRFTRTGRAYTPKETVDAERAVVDVWRAAGSVMLDGRIGVECTFTVGTMRRKDLDNMLKLVLDALNKLAFVDDSQIVSVYAVKKYGSPSTAGSVIKIFEYKDDDGQKDTV